MRRFNLASLVAESGGPLTPAERTIDTVTSEILSCKVRAGEALIRIGQCLIEAKGMLSHGEWSVWLSERVEFSERSAQAYMRIAREFSNPQALADLGATKALMLLSLPPAERDRFAGQRHLVDGEEKSVAEMSSRELQKAIRDRAATSAPPEEPEPAAPPEVLEPEDVRGMSYPDVMALTNHDKRKAVLSGWREWPVWAEVPEIGLTVHRLDLPDGSAFTASWYAGDDFYPGGGDHNANRPRYHLLGAGGKLASGSQGESVFLEHLQAMRVELVKRTTGRDDG